MSAWLVTRHACRLLYKLRGPSFPLNLGLTPAQAAYVDTLTLDQLLEDLHAKKDRDERQGGDTSQATHFYGQDLCHAVQYDGYWWCQLHSLDLQL